MHTDHVSEDERLDGLVEALGILYNADEMVRIVKTMREIREDRVRATTSNPAEFDRLLAWVKAAAWDEGRESADVLPEPANPYR